MDMIEGGQMRDPQYCKDVLVATYLAYRPLSLAELAVLAGLSSEMTQTIVGKCGSFLTITEETVYLIHQSAKDYHKENFEPRLRKGAVLQRHMDLYRRSIDAMSALEQDIHGLRDFGFKPDDMKPPSPDPLAPLRYSCLFWVDHLCDANGPTTEPTKELADDGAVWRFLDDHFLRHFIRCGGQFSISLYLVVEVAPGMWVAGLRALGMGGC